MKIKSRMIPMLLALVLVVGMVPRIAHAEEQWSGGEIEVAAARYEPADGRNAALYPKGVSPSWVLMGYFYDYTLKLIDSSGQVVGEATATKTQPTLKFTGLKAGAYTIKLEIPNFERYSFLYGISNGSTSHYDKTNRLLVSNETTITISQENPSILKWFGIENKAFGFATKTEEIGRFENGGTTKVYFEGKNGYIEDNGITYNSHDGIYWGEYAALYTNMTTLEVPTLSDEEKAKGYTFKGWRLVGDNSGKVYSESEALAHIIKENTTFEALWDYPTHTVSFHTDLEKGDFDGQPASSFTKDFNNQRVGVPPIPTPKEGYEFIGYYSNVGTTNLIPNDELTNTVVNKDLDFYAKYRQLPKNVNVEFKAGEGGATEQATITVQKGKRVGIIPAATANEGYEFSGWKCSEGGNFSSNEVEDYRIPEYAGDTVTFTAQFSKNDGGGGTPGGGDTPGGGGTPGGGDTPGGSNNPIKDLLKTSPIGSNEKVLNDAVVKLNKDGDIKGSTFGRLKLRGWSKGKKAVLLRWTKTSGTSKYVLYGNQCNVKGKKFKYKKIKTFNAKTFKYIPKKIAKKKLKKGTYYKFMIAAVDKYGKVIAVSKTVHVTTAGGKKGNDKSVKRITPKNGKLSLKLKKSKKSKVKEIRGKQKVARHRAVKWESSNTKIAKVTQKGKVTAKAKGKCTIWAYAQNGVYATFKVTVK